MEGNDIGKVVIDAAVLLHRDLDPGLLEAVYEVVLLDELRKRGLACERQVPIPIVCRDIRFDEGFRADIVVDDKVIIELKSIEPITIAHKKQLLSYRRLNDLHLGFLPNFGEALMKNGITRTVSGLKE